MKSLSCLGLLGLALVGSVANADIRQIALPVNDLVYSRADGKIYASVPSRAGGRGNSIARIDPDKGVVETTRFVGSEPNKLALSDDGRTLYVGLDGAAAIARINLRTMIPDLQFPLAERGSLTPLFVLDMEVQPGRPEVIAVSRRGDCCREHVGVAVYENGVKRPTQTTQFDICAYLEFSADSALLYAYDAFGGDYSFCRLGIDSTGVHVVDRVVLSPGTPIGAALLDMKFDSGLLYTSVGVVIDPTTRTRIARVADAGVVLPDSRSGRLFVLETNKAPLKINAYDIQTLSRVGSLSLPGLPVPLLGPPDEAGGLIRWGPDGLAFRSYGVVVLIRSDLVPASRANRARPMTRIVRPASFHAVGSAVQTGVVSASRKDHGLVH